MPHNRIPTLGDTALGLEEEVSFSSHEDLIDDLGEIAIPLKQPTVPAVHDNLKNSTSAPTRGAKKFGLFGKKDKPSAPILPTSASKGESKRHALLTSGLGDDDLLTPQEKARASKATRAALILPEELQAAAADKGGWRAKLGRGRKDGRGVDGLFKTDSRQSGASYGSSAYSRESRFPNASLKTASHPSLPQTSFSPIALEPVIDGSTHGSVAASHTAASDPSLRTPQSIQSRTGTFDSQSSALPTPRSISSFPQLKSALAGQGTAHSRESSLQASIIDEFPSADGSLYQSPATPRIDLKGGIYGAEDDALFLQIPTVLLPTFPTTLGALEPIVILSTPIFLRQDVLTSSALSPNVSLRSLAGLRGTPRSPAKDLTNLPEQYTWVSSHLVLTQFKMSTSARAPSPAPGSPRVEQVEEEHLIAHLHLFAGPRTQTQMSVQSKRRSHVRTASWDQGAAPREAEEVERRLIRGEVGMQRVDGGAGMGGRVVVGLSLPGGGAQSGTEWVCDMMSEAALREWQSRLKDISFTISGLKARSPARTPASRAHPAHAAVDDLLTALSYTSPRSATPGSSRSHGRDSGSTIAAWSKEVIAHTRTTPVSNPARQSTATVGSMATMRSSTSTLTGVAGLRGPRELPPQAPPPEGPLPPIPQGAQPGGLVALGPVAAAGEAHDGPLGGDHAVVDGGAERAVLGMAGLKLGLEQMGPGKPEAGDVIEDTDEAQSEQGSRPMRARQESGLLADEGEDSTSVHSSVLLGSEASSARRRLRNRAPAVDLITEMVDRLDYESEPEPEPEAREEMGRKKSQGKTIRFAGV